MTQKDAISVLRSFRTTELTDDVIARMLSELEGRIEIELHGNATWVDRGTLSVKNPYDRVYWTFLVAMVDLYEGRAQDYAHTYAEFTRAFEAYANHCRNRAG